MCVYRMFSHKQDTKLLLKVMGHSYNVIDNTHRLHQTSKGAPLERERFLSPWFSVTFEVILATLNKIYATEDDDNEKENSNYNT